jgi:hypothetical protein
MKSLLLGIVACVVAASATAQTAAPAPTDKERQRAASTITEQGSGSSASTQKTAKQQADNVKASRQVPKLSNDEKKTLAKDANRLNENPENSSGQAATARMQKETVGQSKATPRQNTAFKSKAGKAELDQGLQQKSSP